MRPRAFRGSVDGRGPIITVTFGIEFIPFPPMCPRTWGWFGVGHTEQPTNTRPTVALCVLPAYVG